MLSFNPKASYYPSITFDGQLMNLLAGPPPPNIETSLKTVQVPDTFQPLAGPNHTQTSNSVH